MKIFWRESAPRNKNKITLAAKKTVATSTRPLPHAKTRDRTGDLQIFSLTLSQLSYRGSKDFYNVFHKVFKRISQGVCKDFIGFHKDFIRPLQSVYQIFTRMLQCVYKVVYKAFSRLLQSF